jgi:hypothetical protein
VYIYIYLSRRIEIEKKMLGKRWGNEEWRP